MSRVLNVPAAGLGSRLKALSTSTPKLLYPVNRKPMLDYLLELYESVVDRFILVVHPAFEERVKRFCASRSVPIECHLQSSPTGMLDAILIPRESVARRADATVWITWCDQVAVHPETVARLAQLCDGEAAVTLPTAHRSAPYIHLVRNDREEIVGVLQRREGDRLPDVGESDMGLFCLSRRAYLEYLPAFASEVEASSATRERNFLPFIPWLAGRDVVRTFPSRDEMEAIGINTAEDLTLVEAYLRRRGV